MADDDDKQVGPTIAETAASTAVAGVGAYGAATGLSYWGTGEAALKKRAEALASAAEGGLLHTYQKTFTEANNFLTHAGATPAGVTAEAHAVTGQAKEGIASVLADRAGGSGSTETLSAQVRDHLKIPKTGALSAEQQALWTEAERLMKDGKITAVESAEKALVKETENVLRKSMLSQELKNTSFFKRAIKYAEHNPKTAIAVVAGAGVGSFFLVPRAMDMMFGGKSDYRERIASDRANSGPIQK